MTSTTVTKSKQTTVPAKFNIPPGAKLLWEEQSPSLYVIRVVPEDPIEAFCGMTKGQNTFDKFMEMRNKDRQKEKNMESNL